MAADDRILLDRYARLRDEEAFAQIVRRYARLVFSTCLRILRDRGRAEEVAQETFLKLVRKPQAVDRSLPGWLHRVATQLSIDVLRSDTSRRARETSHAEEAQAAAAAASAAEPTWQEISPLIDAALAEMDEEDRDLLVAHFLDGRPQRDLAAEANTSPSTICRQVQQALDVLRAKLSSRGVIVGAAVLANWMALETIQQASAGLLRELGKITMLSGPRFGPTAGDPAPPPPKPPLRTRIWTGVQIAAIMVYVMLLLWSLRGQLHPWQRAPVPEQVEIGR